MRRVASGRQRAEAMRDRVERAHAREPEGERAESGEQDVEAANVAGRASDPRRQALVLERSRRLGLVQLHAADTEHRQERDREHDHAEAAEPLDLLTIEQDRRRQSVEADEHARRRGRVARRGLEERVREAHTEREHERHRTERAHRGPHHADDQEPVATAHVDVLAAERQPENECSEQSDAARGGESPGFAVRVEAARCRSGAAASRRTERKARRACGRSRRAAPEPVDLSEPNRAPALRARARVRARAVRPRRSPSQARRF